MPRLSISPKDLIKHGLWFFLAVSLLIHLLWFSPYLIEKLVPEKAPPAPANQAEQSAPPDLFETQQQQKLLEEKQASLHAQLEAAFATITESVDEETAALIWENVALEIDEQMTSMEERLADEDYSTEDFSADYSALTAAMFDQTADSLQDMLRDELKEITLDQVREHTLDKLAHDLDRRMEREVGRAEESTLNRAAQNDTRRRQQEAQQKIDQANRQLHRLRRDQEALAKQTAREERKEVTPQQQQNANRKQQQLQTQRSDAESAILAAVAVAQEFTHTTANVEAPLSQAAIHQENAHQQLAHQKSATHEMQQAADAFKKSEQALAQLAKNVRPRVAVDQEARMALKTLVEEEIKEQVQAEFDQTLQDNLAPESADRILKQAAQYFKEFHMEADESLRSELKKALVETIRKEVPERMQGTASELAMRKTQQKLKLDEVKQQDRKLEVTESRQQQLTKFAQEASKNYESSRKANVERQVKAAQKSAQLGDMSQRMEALKGKMAMMEQATRQAERVREGQSESGELGEMMALMEMMAGNNGEDTGASSEGTARTRTGEGRGKMPPGSSSPWGFRYDGGRGGHTNLAVYKSMLEMARARKEPGAAYEKIDRQAQQLVSQAGPFPNQRDAVLVTPLKTPSKEELARQKEAEEATENARSLAAPDFAPIKYGFATMVREKPVIDGKLNEWDFDRALLVQAIQQGNKPAQLPNDQAIPMAIKWDHEGLYIAAKVNNGQHIQLPVETLWDGTAIEIWLDTRTTRGARMLYPESVQVFFAPFGHQKNPSQVTRFRRGRADGKLLYSPIVSRSDTRGARLGVEKTTSGYDVELFIPQGQGKVIVGPSFEAGNRIGFQISFNFVRGKNHVAWVARSGNSWDRPDLWGDVVLLGSDAEVTFHRDAATKQDLDLIVPGEPVWVKIHDPDMNIDPRYKDQLIVNAVGADNYSKVIVLGETEINSGIFVGGIETASVYTGFREGRLPLEPGKNLQLIYIDQRRDYGESNQRITITLPCAWPTMQLSN